MNKELTCNQVSALINFYLNGRRNPRLKQDFDNHLTKCITCRKKVEDLKKIMSKLVLETNVRLRAEVLDINKDEYDAIVDNYSSERELEQRAKGDFERALIEELGFKPSDINITKFKYRFEEV